MNESNSIKKLIMDLASQIALDENLDTNEGAYCGLYSKGTPSTDCHCEICMEKGGTEDE